MLKKELLAMNSTIITVKKNHLPWTLYHGEHSGIKFHVSFTNRTGMPLQVVKTTCLMHDSPVGVELEDNDLSLLRIVLIFRLIRSIVIQKRNKILSFVKR